MEKNCAKLLIFWKFVTTGIRSAVCMPIRIRRIYSMQIQADSDPNHCPYFILQPKYCLFFTGLTNHHWPGVVDRLLFPLCRYMLKEGLYDDDEIQLMQEGKLVKTGCT